MPSANFFDVLGVRPMLGRTFLPEEEKLGKHFVLILSERFWRRRFGADAGVIGRQVTLNGNVHTIIGVLPETFRFLQPVGMSGWPMGQTDPDVWRPYPYASVDEKNRDFRWLLVIGRLKQGVTVPSAEAELRAISRRIAKSFPDAGAWSVGVKQLHDQVTGHLRIPLLSGRTFTASDQPNTEPKVVINAAFAREYFSNEDSLGKSVLISDDPQPYQIVGVVGDARAQGLGAAPAPEIYQCQLQA